MSRTQIIIIFQLFRCTMFVAVENFAQLRMVAIVGTDCDARRRYASVFQHDFISLEGIVIVSVFDNCLGPSSRTFFRIYSISAYTARIRHCHKFESCGIEQIG